MNVVEGSVEAVSQYGIKINGEWYNKHNLYPTLLDGVSKGDRIRVSYELREAKGKTYRNVTELSTISETVSQEELQANLTEETIGGQEITATGGLLGGGVLGTAKPAPKHAGVTVGMAINNAAAYVLSKDGDKTLPDDVWADTVVSYAEALLKAMDKKGLQ